MKTVYEVVLRLRLGEPRDFKIITGENEIFKKGVVFYRQDKEGSFYGPFVTGETYNAYDVKEMLDKKDIFVES